MKSSSLLARVAALLALALTLSSFANAQGGGADFTRIVSSTTVNGHWLVKMQDSTHIFTGDFTHTKIRAVVDGRQITLTHEQALAVVVPGAHFKVQLGTENGNGIIAVLIALFMPK